MKTRHKLLIVALSGMAILGWVSYGAKVISDKKEITGLKKAIKERDAQIDVSEAAPKLRDNALTKELEETQKQLEVYQMAEHQQRLRDIRQRQIVDYEKRQDALFPNRDKSPYKSDSEKYKEALEIIDKYNKDAASGDLYPVPVRVITNSYPK